MNTYFRVIAIILFFFITGCSSIEKIDHKELEKIEVKNTRDKITEDYFTFRLVSEKDIYQAGEEVILYGEILYKGTEEEIVIHHSASAISFYVREELRGYDLEYAVSEIGASSNLRRLGKPYRSHYKKSSVQLIPFDNPSEDEGQFVEEVKNSKSFPPGYYTVKGIADFHVEITEDGENGSYKMEAAIDFKVVD
jgi:hypothetical protein